MASANLLPRPAETSATSAKVSLARILQLIEAIQTGQDALLGRGILDGGVVTKTAAFSVSLATGTKITDSGMVHTLTAPKAYTAAVTSSDIFLWGILERTSADPMQPMALDTYDFRLAHTLTPAAPIEGSIPQDRWIPLSEWETDGSGIIDASINDNPDGKYITDLASSLGDLADVIAEVETARGSLPSLDQRLDVLLNEDGTIKISALSALDIKQSVRAASTANLTLSGAQTVDGVSLIAGDRILVKNQSTANQNGIYVVAVGAWSRAADANASADVTAGMLVPVTEGTVGADTLWMLSTNDPITLGFTGTAFKQVAGWLAGDVTGAPGANTVERIRGKSVPDPGASEDEKALVYDHGTGAYVWTALPEPSEGDAALTVRTLLADYVLDVPVGTDKLMSVNFTALGAFPNGGYHVWAAVDGGSDDIIVTEVLNGKGVSGCRLYIQNASDAGTGAYGTAEQVRITVYAAGHAWTEADPGATATVTVENFSGGGGSGDAGGGPPLYPGDGAYTIAGASPHYIDPGSDSYLGIYSFTEDTYTPYLPSLGPGGVGDVYDNRLLILVNLAPPDHALILQITPQEDDTIHWGETAFVTLNQCESVTLLADTGNRTWFVISRTTHP